MAGDVELDHVRFGRADGPQVLLIMGLGGQRIMWPDELIEALVVRGMGVITVDNRDVGASSVLSDHPGGEELVAEVAAGRVHSPYRLADMAADLADLCATLGVQHVHVVGVSMGGMIAQHLMANSPHLVASAVLISTTTGDWHSQDAQQSAPRTLLPPTDLDAFTDWFAGGARELAAPGAFDEAGVRALARAVHARGVHPDGLARQLAAVLADDDRTAMLADVRAPVLVLHGIDDPLIGVAAGRALAAAIPGAELEVIDHMAHDLPRAAVASIGARVADHIDGAERG